MLNKIKKPKYSCGLDIGSQRIKACVIQTKKGHDAPEILGIFEAPTRGLSQASISDLTELSECIHATMDGLMKKTGLKLKDLQVGIGGNFILPKRCQAVIPLLDKGSKVISYSDIKKINHQAKLLGIKMEEEILHDFPQHYRVDDMNPSLNPLGLYGRKLEVDMLLLCANTSRMNNIMKAVNQAGYEVSKVSFTSYAASEASLNKKFKTDGCVVVDIGSSITDVLIFKDNVLRHAEYISLGGDHVTRSIAHALNLSFDLAENLKKSYAVALSGDVKADEEILVKKEENYIPIKREAICQAIEGEIEKLVTLADEVVRKSGFYDQINMGVVMMGGGALLPGLIERIENKTNLPVSIGKINIDTSRSANAAIYGACVGLAQMECNQSAVSPLPVPASGHWMANVSNKVKEVYQEYF